MPKQGLQMTEGTITEWLIPEGGRVTEGQPLFEMETDKLTIKIDSSFNGVLLKILRAAGETVPITEPIALIGEEGEDVAAQVAEIESKRGLAQAPKDAEKPKEAPAAPAPAPVRETVPADIPAQPQPNGRILSSPLARRLADEKHLDLSTIRGSGEGGMIVERDVLAAASAPAGQASAPVAPRSVPVPAADGSETVVPFSGMRKAIADNMKRSLDTMAQASHRVTVDMTQAKMIREALKQQDRKVSYNDILIMALTRALLEFPRMNGYCDEEGIHEVHAVHMGIAVAIDNGLIVPTLRNAHALSLDEIHSQSAELAANARAGKLRRDDYTGGTFTVTNLGMFGLDEFTAVINPPQIGIMAAGAVRDLPAVRDGQIVIRPQMVLTLTYDHRAVDGAPAARFLVRVRELLENPYTFLL